MQALKKKFLDVVKKILFSI